ncbi:hypothetical protein SCHPADRAFT_616884 [Schizopora paradoxa]|uniref:Uncharacterized protein n=1 Tax=Schizopora paradoxa TaxID=27342 RepID=A0A0H2RA18_9AGAM|nr:hypothetical protein SCHPADRAFT_616884 [Schizopora paradoxa]
MFVVCLSITYLVDPIAILGLSTPEHTEPLHRSSRNAKLLDRFDSSPRRLRTQPRTIIAIDLYHRLLLPLQCSETHLGVRGRPEGVA